MLSVVFLTVSTLLALAAVFLLFLLIAMLLRRRSPGPFDVQEIINQRDAERTEFDEDDRDDDRPSERPNNPR